MNFWKTLYVIADKVGIPTTQIGPKLGFSREYVANNKSKRINPSLTVAARILDVCGYALCALPKTDIPENAYLLGIDDQDDSI